MQRDDTQRALDRRNDHLSLVANLITPQFRLSRGVGEGRAGRPTNGRTDVELSTRQRCDEDFSKFSSGSKSFSTVASIFPRGTNKTIV